MSRPNHSDPSSHSNPISADDAPEDWRSVQGRLDQADRWLRKHNDDATIQDVCNPVIISEPERDVLDYPLDAIERYWRERCTEPFLEWAERNGVTRVSWRDEK